MNRLHALLGVAVLLAGAGLLSAGGGDAKTVRVVGLRINQPLPDQERNLAQDAFDPGTRLSVIVTQPGKALLGIDASASKLERFTDDKNTDLNKTDFGGWVDAFGARTSADRSSIGFQVRSKVVPAAGASKLRLKGTLALRVGGGEKMAEEKNVTLKADAKVKVGPVELSLSKNAFGDGTPLEVTYPNRVLKKIEFLDKDGKALQSSTQGGMSVGDGAKTIYTDNYSLKGKAEQLTVRVTYFGKVETVTVPLDLEVGLGL
jgi:hypothetical protein